MLSLFLKNLFFTILQPGLLAGLIPYFIVKNDLIKIDFKALTITNYFGLLLFLVGLGILFLCIYYFIIIGKGTLSPADKSKELIILGIYKYSRNPMYIGVLSILLGEVIFTKSIVLLFYLVFIFIGFHFFVIFKEEPRLKKDFGKQYDTYMLQVNRWI